MKQYITNEQMQELSPSANNRLQEWIYSTAKFNETSGIKDKDCCSVCGKKLTLNIGQMLQFLHEKFPPEEDYHISIFDIGDDWDFSVRKLDTNDIGASAPELCDAIFEVVKQVL